MTPTPVTRGPRTRIPRPGGSALLAAAVLASAAVLSSCSSGSDGGAETPQVAVETFFHAIGEKDPEAACSVVSTDGAPLQGTPLDQCRTGFEKVLGTVQDQGDIELLKAAKVTGASVTGDRATILSAQITQVPAGFENDIDLVRLGGRWYIDSKTDPSTEDTATPSAPTG